MNGLARKNAINGYKSSATSEIEVASPHRLIQMLFEGALERMATAKCAIINNDIEMKCKFINSSISIIGGLRESLDLTQGDIATNLDMLYEYMEFRLVDANIKNDTAIIDEVCSLLKSIKSAWDEIAPK